MGIVRIHLRDETEECLAQHGLNASEFLQNVAEAEARRLTALDTLDSMAALRKTMRPTKTPSEQLLREARDA